MTKIALEAAPDRRGFGRFFLIAANDSDQRNRQRFGSCSGWLVARASGEVGV
ncbi:hypothetical protein [Sphingomonas koreensis]|uniref:hypothetical protein n=1 Tax=Sphingomonas koreensis TaxID=93064 RepID=UPI000A41FF09|nr:hypothetical protein [Sphingomonas koreensis]